MKPRLVKGIAKIALGFGVSALIGYAIKAEKDIEGRLDEHYDKKKDDTNHVKD